MSINDRKFSDETSIILTRQEVYNLISSLVMRKHYIETGNYQLDVELAKKPNISKDDEIHIKLLDEIIQKLLNCFK